jgi:hypothetical protein
MRHARVAAPQGEPACRRGQIESADAIENCGWRLLGGAGDITGAIAEIIGDKWQFFIVGHRVSIQDCCANVFLTETTEPANENFLGTASRVASHMVR